MQKIKFLGVVTDTASYMYGEFRQPGVLTNDLVNNKEYKKGKGEADEPQVIEDQKTISMSHIKRVHCPPASGQRRILICSKSWYESEQFDCELKRQISLLAGATESLKLSDLKSNDAAVAEERKEGELPQENVIDSGPNRESQQLLPVETVTLPDRIIYVREIYERQREIANGWPITFKTSPPNFQFIPGNFDLPDSLKQELVQSDIDRCTDGQVCMLVRKKTFQVVCKVESSDFVES